MWTFIICGLVSVAVAVAGGYHDWIILSEGRGKISESAKWIGNIIEMLLVWMVCFVFRENVKFGQHLFLMIDTGVIWWIVHDMTIGKLLEGSIWYVGNTGFDKKMKEMFQNSGKFYAGIRMFILTIFTLSYFSYEIIWK